MSKNITLNSTDEEKKEALDRQKRSVRRCRNDNIFHYGVIIFWILMIVFCILEMTGITHISWYSRLMNR